MTISTINSRIKTINSLLKDNKFYNNGVLELTKMTKVEINEVATLLEERFDLIPKNCDIDLITPLLNLKAKMEIKPVTYQYSVTRNNSAFFEGDYKIDIYYEARIVCSIHPCDSEFKHHTPKYLAVKYGKFNTKDIFVAI